MSFQDVGKNNSHRRTANATLQKSGTATAGSAGASWGAASSSGPSVGQISEALTQYQRNVGILEKISQQLVSTGSNNNSSTTRNELEQQYKVQLDVLRQLEQRVRTAILAQRQQIATMTNNEAKQQALRKLERDFERVQSTAQSCKAKVMRQQKQLQQRGNNGNTTTNSDNAAANALQQEQERFQIQIQEDKLAEEIMREREQEIRTINKGMHQVNEIYKDLAHIVGNQQEQVDQIETQMEDARGNAESGLKQVQTANEKYDSQCTIS